MKSGLFLYILVGGFAFLINFLTYFSLILFGVSFWLSSILGSVLGILAAFFLQKRFAFRSAISVRRGLPRHLLVYGLQILGSLTILTTMINCLNLQPIIAFFVSALIVTPLTYLAQAKFTFHEAGASQ
jgi:putative flippase GtrA